MRLAPTIIPMMIPTRNMMHCHSGVAPNVAFIIGLLFLLSHSDLYTTMTHHPLSTLGEIDFYHFHPPVDSCFFNYYNRGSRRK